MRKGDGLLRVVSFFVFVAVAVYFGYAWLDSRRNPFVTAFPEEAAAEESLECTCFVARDELPLALEDYCCFEAADGERVSVGTVLAGIYSTPGALARAEQRRALQLELDALTALRDAGGGREAVYRGIIALTGAQRLMDGAGMESASAGLKVLLQDGGAADETALSQRIDRLEGQLARLADSGRTDIRPVTAEAPGIFCQSCDGLEGIGTSRLYGKSPTELEALYAAAQPPAQARLVTGISWCCAVILDKDSAAPLFAGRTVRMQFGSISGVYEMTVDDVGAPDAAGRLVAILRSDRDLEAALSLRREQKARLILSSGTGWALPEEALHFRADGSACVYVVSGLAAKELDVEVLQIRDGRVIVRAGDRQLGRSVRVIVRANDLYDGKVLDRRGSGGD